MNAQVEAAAPIARVALAELIALRARVARLHLAPAASHARRAGGQASRTYGRGMDYAESRVYQAGDDVRRLDWRLTARSGRLHTKLFQEDHDAALLILLDTHASMRFGTRTRFKSVQAARAAAAAAWYAVRAGERVVRRLRALAQESGTGRINLSQDELAALSATSRSAVAQVLSQLRAAGAVTTARRSIEVIDIAKLESIDPLTLTTD